MYREKPAGIIDALTAHRSGKSTYYKMREF